MPPRRSACCELNPTHAVFGKLAAAQEAGDKDKVALYASLLLDQALLVAGMPVEDPVKLRRERLRADVAQCGAGGPDGCAGQPDGRAG